LFVLQVSKDWTWNWKLGSGYGCIMF